MSCNLFASRGRIAGVFGAALVLIMSASSAACGVEGERALRGCPADEVCSPETPDGLRFAGEGTFDSSYSYSWLPTAVGGTQRIEVQPAIGDDDVPRFRAESADARVFEVVGVGSDVAVRATGPGSALLRITDESGALFDRTTLSTAEVDRIELLPGVELGRSSRTWAFRRGSSGRIVFALRSSDGTRLIDESAQPVVAPGVEPIAWDAAHVTFDGDGSELVLDIDLGAGRRRASAPLADTIDRIVNAGYQRATVSVGGKGRLCLVAMLGERAVNGVHFEVTSEGPIEVTPLDYGAPALLCVEVEGLEAGDATLIVRADGVELRKMVWVEE